MRGVLILALFPLLMALPPAAAEAAGADSGDRTIEIDKTWRSRFAKLEERVTAGRWQAAAEAAEGLVPEMASETPAGLGGRRQVAAALALWAVAEVGLGREDDALWRWQIAQNLDPELGSAPRPASWGETGAWLESRRLRPAASWPEGVAAPLGEVEPPVPITAPIPYPKLPPESRQLWFQHRLEVEVLIDAEGRVRSPVVVAGGELPAKLYFGLDGLRSWSFRPARTAAGEPVPALYRLKEFVGPQPQAFSQARGEQTQEAHRLLLAGRWQEARAALAPLLRACDTAVRSGACLPRALALHALATAGAGDVDEALWHWHLVEAVGSPFTVEDLAFYGRDLTRPFADHPRPCPADPACTVPRADEVPGLQPPVAVDAPRAELPPELAEEIGSDRLIAEVVVDTDGRVSDPTMLAGHAQAAGYPALQALRRWRFAPAQRNGEPVAVRLEVTVPVEPAVPAEEQQSWEERMARIEPAIVAGDGQSVRAEAQSLTTEIAARAGRGGSDLLARALLQLALAEAGAGDEESALWHWQTAQNLAVEYRVRDLSGYGPAGELLARHRLRRPGQGSEVGGALPLDSSPARPVAGEAPSSPATAAKLQEIAVVEVIVDPDGRPHSPLVLRGRSPAGLFAVLEALRTWRFAPHSGGPVRREVVLDVTPRQPLPQLGVSPYTARLADLALKVVRLDPAVARCHWQSALVQEPALTRADLSQHGQAADVLGNTLAPLDDRWGFPCAAVPPKAEARHTAADGPLQNPVRISGEYPQYTEETRRLRAQGTVIAQSVITEEGHLDKVTILQGVHPELDLVSIAAFCGWRFQPALLGGEPVPALYNLTTNFSLSSRRVAH